MLNISGKIYVHCIVDGDVQIKGLAVSVLRMIMSHSLLCYIRLDYKVMFLHVLGRTGYTFNTVV